MVEPGRRQEVAYLRGAFLIGPPRGAGTTGRAIPFRFNPESISRQLAVEAGQAASGTEGANPRAEAAPAAEASADATMGALKESFSVQVRLDFGDRDPSLGNLSEAYGIAPEIAALEDLLYPEETPADESSDGAEGVRAKRARPSVLFVWGSRRVLPVRIASLTINETVFNDQLNPVRAEIDVALEVLAEGDVLANERAKAALGHTDAWRRRLAVMYHDNTASQSGRYLELEKEQPPP